MRFRHGAALFLFLIAVGAFAHFQREEAAADTKKVVAKQSGGVEKIIVPFVNKHCVMCHGPKKKNAGLALHIYTDEKSILKDRKKWHEVVRMVHSGEMPEAKQPRPDLKDVDNF